MPKTERLVINTGPILALIAGTGDLAMLRSLGQKNEGHSLLIRDAIQRMQAHGVWLGGSRKIIPHRRTRSFLLALLIFR